MRLDNPLLRRRKHGFNGGNLFSGAQANEESVWVWNGRMQQPFSVHLSISFRWFVGVVWLVCWLFSRSEDTFNTVIAFTGIEWCMSVSVSQWSSVHMMATSLRWCSNCSMLRLHHACRHSHFCFIITVVELQHLHESITAERSTRHVPRIPSASNDVTPYTTTTYTVDQNVCVQCAVVRLAANPSYTIGFFYTSVDN